MLKQSRLKVGRYADVERAAWLAGEDVDAWLLGHDVCISGLHNCPKLVSGLRKAHCPTNPKNAMLNPMIDFVT
jgi:hypothetical protein